MCRGFKVHSCRMQCEWKSCYPANILYDLKIFGPEITFHPINLCQVEGNIVNVFETKGSQLPQVKEGKAFLNEYNIKLNHERVKSMIFNIRFIHT